MSIQFLQHYCLTVPDLALGRKFYEDFGLEAEDRGDHLALRCSGRDQDQVLLVEGTRRRLHHISLGTNESALPGLREAINASGTEFVDPPVQVPNDGLWFRDPEGTLINVCSAESAPWAVAPEWRINTPGHYVRQGMRGFPSRDTVVKPRRLGHVMTFTTKLERQVEFYTQVLGLRLSDRSQDIVAFMHCPGGSDHHVLAFLSGTQPGFHHASFEVANVDEVGLGGRQMIVKGYRDGWGFGRHVIGSNFFHYIRDPWNSMAEYYCDIDYIPADMTWESKNWPAESSLYIWGPDVPADFPVNFENPD